MDLTCSKRGCRELGIYRAILELHPVKGSYPGGNPAYLFFPELLFCEAHGKELQWENLIYPDALLGMFSQFGQPSPDMSKTQVRLEVVQGVETV